MIDRLVGDITGVIERRILVNYRVDPEAIRSVLPSVFEPQLVDGFAITLTSNDGSTRLHVDTEVVEDLPSTSVFDSLAHVSDFFEAGGLGYSDTAMPNCYDGLELETDNWSVTPLRVLDAASSYFGDTTNFPAGSVEIDNALLMRNISHTWRAREAITT